MTIPFGSSWRKWAARRAPPLLAEFATEKKADAELDKSAELWGNGDDVTKALIKKVDAEGPLKL